MLDRRVTARGGRAGWDVQKHAVNTILKPRGLTLRNSITYLSKEAKKIKDGDTKEIENLWSMIDKIQTVFRPTPRGKISKDEFIEGLNTVKGKDINFIHPKMLGTYVLYAFPSHDPVVLLLLKTLMKYPMLHLRDYQYMKLHHHEFFYLLVWQTHIAHKFLTF